MNTDYRQSETICFEKKRLESLQPDFSIRTCCKPFSGGVFDENLLCEKCVDRMEDERLAELKEEWDRIDEEEGYSMNTE